MLEELDVLTFQTANNENKMGVMDIFTTHILGDTGGGKETKCNLEWPYYTN